MVTSRRAPSVGDDRTRRPDRERGSRSEWFGAELARVRLEGSAMGANFSHRRRRH